MRISSPLLRTSVETRWCGWAVSRKVCACWMKSWCRSRRASYRPSSPASSIAASSPIARICSRWAAPQTWTLALTGWSERQPEMVAHVGQCLIHRSEVLHLRGQWRAALQEARRVITRFAHSMNSPVTGHALYRQGEVYRLQGRFDRADRLRTVRPRDLVTSRSPDLRCCALAQGKTTAAVSAIRRALAESNDSVRRARLLPACVEIFLANRNLEQAQQACGELEDSREGPQKQFARRARWPSPTARWNWREGKPRRGP